MRINSNTNNSSSSDSKNNPTSWMGWKEKASKEYQDGKYEAALDSYRTSITSFTSTNKNGPPPPDERQIILSNMVACRLKIGGPVQAEAAVTTAKQCININPQWAKGHIRLASSYIALGGHSNDACNALQRALQLDPTNPTARNMLVKELRRDNNTANTTTPATSPPDNQDDRNYSFSSTNTNANTNTNTNTNTSASASAPPEDQDDRNYSTTTNRSSSSPSSSSSRRPTEESPFFGRYEDQPPSTQPTERPNNNNTYNDGIDETITWQDKLLFYYQRAKLWYMGQSDDVKSLFKVLLVLLLLYIAFGGRFGFESSSNVPKRRGNYGKGNVYDQYYGRGDSSSASYPYSNNNNDGDASSGSDYGRASSSSSKNTYNEQQQPHRQASSSSGYHRDNNYQQQQQQQQRSHYDDVDDYYYRSTSSNHRRQRGGSSSSSFHFPNLFDGSPQSMLILAGIAYMCYRNGINPMQAIFFLNMMNRGGGRRHHRGGMGMGGYGGGMGGYGGFGRRGFGRRRW